MTCNDCLKAAQKQHHGFAMDCRGCCARAIARGPNYREAKQAGRQTIKYRGELTQFGMSHEDVLKAAAADKLGNKRP